MIVLTPGHYALTIFFIALMGVGTGVKMMRYRKARAASDLVRLIASPLAFAGFAMMYTNRWGSVLLVPYALIVFANDALQWRHNRRLQDSNRNTIEGLN